MRAFLELCLLAAIQDILTMTVLHGSKGFQTFAVFLVKSGRPELRLTDNLNIIIALITTVHLVVARKLRLSILITLTRQLALVRLHVHCFESL